MRNRKQHLKALICEFLTDLELNYKPEEIRQALNEIIESQDEEE